MGRIRIRCGDVGRACRRTLADASSQRWARTTRTHELGHFASARPHTHTLAYHGSDNGGTWGRQALRQVLADADDSDEVDYNLERARLESLFGGTA